MNDAMGFMLLYSNHFLPNYLSLSLLRSCMPLRETIRHGSKRATAAAILLTVPSVLPVPLSVRYLASFVLLLLFSVLFFEASLFRKCFLTSLAFAAAFAGLTLTVDGICLLQSTAFKATFLQQCTPATCRFLPAVISCLITGLLLKGIRKLYSKEDAPSPLFCAQQAIMMPISICSIGIFLLLLPGMLRTSDRLLLSAFGLILVALCLLHLFVWQLLEKENRENRASFEETLIRQQQNSQLRIDELKFQYETLAKSRHDFKNVLCVVRSLNQERKHTQIEHYIAAWLEDQQSQAALVATDDEYLNALISAKASEARSQDIDVHIVLSSQRQSTDSVALCSMLGNMFDNAITACLKLKEGRKITLRIYDDGSETVFCMKNTILAPVLANNPDLQTEKNDTRNHGYGTRIIREVAQKHGGFADFYEEGNLFCCNVVLHLTQNT